MKLHKKKSFLHHIWIFLRNRWNRRSYDLFVAIIVIVGIRYQILSVSLLSMMLLPKLDMPAGTTYLELVSALLPVP